MTDNVRGTLVELDGYGFVRIPWGTPPDQIDETAVYGLPVSWGLDDACPLYRHDEQRKVWVKA